MDYLDFNYNDRQRGDRSINVSGRQCDVFLEQRHRFVRRFQRPEAIEGPYHAEQGSMIERYVVAALVGVALFVFLCWFAGIIA